MPDSITCAPAVKARTSTSCLGGWISCPRRSGWPCNWYVNWPRPPTPSPTRRSPASWCCTAKSRSSGSFLSRLSRTSRIACCSRSASPSSRTAHYLPSRSALSNHLPRPNRMRRARKRRSGSSRPRPRTRRRCRAKSMTPSGPPSPTRHCRSAWPARRTVARHASPSRTGRRCGTTIPPTCPGRRSQPVSAGPCSIPAINRV